MRAGRADAAGGEVGDLVDLACGFLIVSVLRSSFVRVTVHRAAVQQRTLIASVALLDGHHGRQASVEPVIPAENAL